MAAKDPPRNDRSAQSTKESTALTRRDVVKAFAGGLALGGLSAAAGTGIARAVGWPEVEEPETKVSMWSSFERTALPKNINLSPRFKEMYPSVARSIEGAANQDIRRHTTGQTKVALAVWAKRDSNLQANKVGGSPANPTYGLYQFSAEDLGSGKFSEYGLNTPEDALDPVKASNAAALYLQEYNNSPDPGDLGEIPHQDPRHEARAVALEKSLEAFEGLVSQGLVSGPRLKAPESKSPDLGFR